MAIFGLGPGSLEEDPNPLGVLSSGHFCAWLTSWSMVDQLGGIFEKFCMGFEKEATIGHILASRLMMRLGSSSWGTFSKEGGMGLAPHGLLVKFSKHFKWWNSSG
jgi:hypothetical protein